MKITLNLPEFTIDPDDHAGFDPETGAPEPFEDCPHCHLERNGRMVKALDGWVHEGCVKAWIGRRPEREAWRTVAKFVARYPSRQSAPTVRAAITALLAQLPPTSDQGDLTR